MIIVSILNNSITHAHTYVIVVLCVPVATHGHLPSVIRIFVLLCKISWTYNGHLRSSSFVYIGVVGCFSTLLHI
jgi:hypothetical protein